MLKNILIFVLMVYILFSRYDAKRQFIKGKNQGYKECLGCDLNKIYDCIGEGIHCPITGLADDGGFQSIRKCSYRKD